MWGGSEGTPGMEECSGRGAQVRGRQTADNFENLHPCSILQVFSLTNSILGLYQMRIRSQNKKTLMVTGRKTEYKNEFCFASHRKTNVSNPSCTETLREKYSPYRL